MTRGLEPQAQQEDAHYYREFFTHFGDSIFFIDVAKDGHLTVVSINPAAEHAFSLTDAQVRGKSRHQFFPVDLADRLETYDHACVISERPMHYEEMLKQSCGMRYFSVSLMPMRDAGGRISRIAAIWRDITERKRQEQASIAYEAKYRVVFESANDGVFLHRIVEQDGVTQFILHDINPKGCELWGHTREDMLSGNLDLLAMGDPPYTFEEATRRNQLAAAGHPQLFDWQLKRRDGSKIWGEVNLRSIQIGSENFLLAVMRNVSDRKTAEDALQAREKEFRTLAENIPDNIARYDRQCRMIYINPKLEATMGVPVISLLGEMALKPGLPDWLAGYRTLLRQVMASGESAESDLVVPDMGQGERYHHVRYVVERDGNGEITGALTIGHDVTERKRMEEVLAARERESRTLVENSPDTIARYDRACRRSYVNPAFGALVEGGVAALLGKTPAQCPGGPNAAIYESKINEVFVTGQDAEFELTWAGHNGKEVCSLIRLTPERDASGVVASVLGVGRDITDLNTFRQQIHHMAFHDALTALPNRALFNDRLQQVLSEASRHGRLAGVMMLDLDHFKNINDTLGHAAGDQLLAEAATRLSGCIRSQDTVARMGGDEFAILLPSIRSRDDLGQVARKILQALTQPFMLEDREMSISGSLGIAVFPQDHQEAGGLMKQADAAMYLAKQAGRNGFRFIQA